VNGSNSDSSIVLLTITVPTVCYSDASEWILDTDAAYHIFPKRDWFASFEKLDNSLVQMGDDSTSNMDGVGTVLIKMFDGMVRELKDVRYIPQMKKSLISIGALEAQDLECSGRGGVLKMLKGSMVISKGVRCNNLYCLNGNMVTAQLTTFVGSDEDSTRLGI